MHLRSWIAEDCFLSNKELKRRLLEERQLIVSESAISECVRGMHYSFKRVTKRVEDAFHAEHKQARHEYATWMLYDALPQQKSLIFYDECPFNVSTRRHYGRAPK